MTSGSELEQESIRVGAVGLTVADLERSVNFYRGAIGLDQLSRSGSTARVGVGQTTLVELTEEPGAVPSVAHTGLFHLALRVPERADLARWVLAASQAGVRIDGAADHWVSEAIYLSDPDGHGIEVYVDRPRHEWEGQVERMTTYPLDLVDLVATVSGEDPTGPPSLPSTTDMGHVHLRVADVAETETFYRDVVGLDVMARFGRGAVFLAADGYHHHIGANTWQSRGAGPAGAGHARLRYATLEFADEASRDAAVERARADSGSFEEVAGGWIVTDPSENPLLLTSDPGSNDGSLPSRGSHPEEQ